MSRPFGMWILRSVLTSVRTPQLLVRGPTIGGFPDVGDAMLLHSPFAAPLRLHCRSIVTTPRGREDAAPGLGIDPIARLDARQLAGAILTQEGTALRAFTARVRAPGLSGVTAARFELEGDRAWGLVSIAGGTLNAVVVGGGLPGGALWPTLVRIVLRDLDAVLEAGQLVAVEDDLHPSIWQLRTLETYVQGDQQALVLKSAGPVLNPDGAVRLGSDWRRANVLQQREGITQLFVDAAPGISGEAVVVPWPIAA